MGELPFVDDSVQSAVNWPSPGVRVIELGAKGGHMRALAGAAVLSPEITTSAAMTTWTKFLRVGINVRT
jgi:hypothetical protein